MTSDDPRTRVTFSGRPDIYIDGPPIAPTVEVRRVEVPYVRLHVPTKRGTNVEAPPTSPRFVGVGRNSRCPCGSGAKFKHCHLKELR